MVVRYGRFFAVYFVGHIYAIGECGGANQVSRCPECNATIGGTDHRLTEGNSFAPEMDQAQRPAWPGMAMNQWKRFSAHILPGAQQKRSVEFTTLNMAGPGPWTAYVRIGSYCVEFSTFVRLRPCTRPQTRGGFKRGSHPLAALLYLGWGPLGGSRCWWLAAVTHWLWI